MHAIHRFRRPIIAWSFVLLAGCSSDAADAPGSSGSTGASGGSGPAADRACNAAPTGSSPDYPSCLEFLSGPGGERELCESTNGTVVDACDRSLALLGCCKNAGADICYYTGGPDDHVEKQLESTRGVCSAGRGEWRAAP